MSAIIKKLEAHKDKLIKEIDNAKLLLAQSETGKQMMRATSLMAQSEKMMRLMNSIDNSESYKEIDIISQYLAKMIESNPERGLAAFSNYLVSISNDPKYATRSSYYLSISKAALDLNNSYEYQEYVIASKNFENDTSENGNATHKAMQSAEDIIKLVFLEN